MKIHLQQDLQNYGPAPPISYKLNITVNKKPESKSDTLYVYINTHPGEAGSEPTPPPPLYVPVLNQESPEVCLKLQTTLQKISKV